MLGGLGAGFPREEANNHGSNFVVMRLAMASAASVLAMRAIAARVAMPKPVPLALLNPADAAAAPGHTWLTVCFYI